MFGVPFLRRRHERAGFLLYGDAVAAARLPLLYEALAVPDTLDGRFDLVGVHVALLIRRLRALPAPGPALAQATFDAMFSDMDTTLREFGLDLGVGRRVRAMWEAFHGRALAYEAPLAAGDRAALGEALARNVWRGAAPGTAADRLAGWVMAQDAALHAAAPQAVLAGHAAFLDAADWSAGAGRAGVGGAEVGSAGVGDAGAGDAGAGGVDRVLAS